MEPLVEQFLRSPKMELYLKQINTARDAERKARERFLQGVTEDEKTEFVNGDLLLHSPVRAIHNEARRHLFRLLSTFVDTRRLGLVGDEKWMISLTRNDYEPDVCFWGLGLSAKFEPHQMLFPAPEFVVEVLSPSTEALDRGIKFEDYAAHEVGEYWIIDPDAKTVEQYRMGSDEKYELILKSSSGVIRSTVIVGFEIPIIAIFDDQENLKTLRALLG